MNFDLQRILAEWDCPEDELCARMIQGIDGRDVLQLRVELGVLQMAPDGRPDGQRYQDCATVLAWVRQGLERDDEIDLQTWHELRRELNQFNYRRLAYSYLAEDAVLDEDTELARLQLSRTIRDIDHCLGILRLGERECPEIVHGNLTLIPALIFNRSRLLARLRAVEQRYEEAIQEAEAGAEALRLSLETAGFDEEQIAEDTGIAYLEQYAQRLREQFSIDRTLRERLNEAIDNEDFEAAARLHARLRGQDGGRND